jgi:hypothetical protein
MTTLRCRHSRPSGLWYPACVPTAASSINLLHDEMDHVLPVTADKSTPCSCGIGARLRCSGACTGNTTECHSALFTSSKFWRLYSAIAPSSATPRLSDCSNTPPTGTSGHFRRPLQTGWCWSNGWQAGLTSSWRYTSVDQYSIFSDVSKQNMGSLSILDSSAGRLNPLRRSCSLPGSSRSLQANSCMPQGRSRWQMYTTREVRARHYRCCHTQPTPQRSLKRPAHNVS